MNGKVVGIITDNGYNFIKTFPEYSISSPESPEAAVPEDLEDVEEDEFVFQDLNGLLQVDEESTEDLTDVQHELQLYE